MTCLIRLSWTLADLRAAARPSRDDTQRALHLWEIFMSRESLTWLNRNTLIGFTTKRGTAWHSRARHQGDEPNHYPGPIPVSDVKRRLFGWEPVRAPLRRRT